jgi:uncharacterized Ntn-hydrolase superfamily protein
MRPIARFLALTAILGCWAGSAAAGDPSGTFSIVAFDPQTGELGVAVQSKAFSVGSGVPWAKAGVGAIATQSQTNESFGPRGLAMMGAGFTAAQTLEALLAADPGREHRQVGIVDARRHSAAFTGSQCSEWAGDSTLAGLSVQGNILAGAPVVSEMVRAYQEETGELAERLLAALQAGQAAGGDRRGQQSAALLVVRPSEQFPEYETRYIDLRVEDNPAPIDELERIFRIHQGSDLLRAHLRYAALYDSLGDEAAAARERQRIGETLRKVLASDTADAGTLNALAWFCATADLYLPESLQAAQRAVELKPKSTDILDTLAEVYFRMGRKDEALSTIERALEIQPDDAYLQGQRARFLGK